MGPNPMTDVLIRKINVDTKRSRKMAMLKWRQRLEL